MTKLATKQWEILGWERGDQLRDKEGNQGHAFNAKKASDPNGDFSFILKTLKRQTDPARRAMFRNETLAMSSVEHEGILQIESTNAEQYKESVELYLITRRIQGPDLEELVTQGISFEESITIALGVLDILEHCHERGVIHRDIKPCHIFVENRNFESPLLIDFGLAYTEDNQLSDAATAIDEGRVS